MTKRAKSQLKKILDERGMSIRELERLSEGKLKFETLRKLYNDDAKQYQRDTIGIVCEILEIEINDLLILIDNETENRQEN
ncbi:helix-turn-helix transcriptional regulator [Schinkia azotoformans]|uniref:helix-turn-helix domain-containing protein n=1 Tax=Schinkia azotoformans TaxID=1454 RepID=UPI002DB6539D|nr:helix-turn-helix transcriptional regulator [Schinkia azotoformans]MEC1726906.1 helix-turn-helix transcriptional regulator [Schinkia azotoformans]